MQTSENHLSVEDAPKPIFTADAYRFALENSWRTEVTEFPLNVRPVRFFQRPKRFKNPITSSPFRTGTMHIEGDGVRLTGVGIRASKWTGLISGSFAILYVCVRVLLQFANTWWNEPVARFVSLSLAMILLFGSVGFGLYTEYLRIPMETYIPWDNLTELQIEPRSRWAVLLYDSGQASLLNRAVTHSLSINAAHPGVIFQLAEAFERRVPDRVRRNVSRYEWTPARRIIVTILVIAAVFSIAIAVIAATRW